MIRVISIILTLLLIGCNDNRYSGVNKSVDNFLKASNEYDIRCAVYLPKELETETEAKIINDCLDWINASNSQTLVQKDIQVSGRWAAINFEADSSPPKSLRAIYDYDQWRIFWDPTGSLMWGKQEWHTKLSKVDWDDYNKLKK